MLTHENEKNPKKAPFKSTPLGLFRTPAMRRLTISLSMSWFSSSFSFFAIAMDIQRFGFSLHLIQVIFGSAEIPLRILSTIIAAYVGRRFAVSLFLIFSGVLILCSLAIPSDLIVLQLSVTVVAKGFLGSSMLCAYLYTAELFPTELRQTGMGFTNMMMRLGAVVAPLVMITKAYAPLIPLVVFGIAPILCGLPILWLPETLNSHLLDTVEEVEARGQNSTSKKKKELEFGTKL
ncbi:hypothetical protein GDO81_018915 [Engystomops pustulosus]|uniref:Major facilitator superfamily (MFS) profile domain-containing protein n=1 Tax=Engystomops pustulosus TaxID=76066 RepID=A0AAV6Z044_ENGPU|nr:hypothetical protein GDO81_018915 [Engystomops pustulosus]